MRVCTAQALQLDLDSHVGSFSSHWAVQTRTRLCAGSTLGFYLRVTYRPTVDGNGATQNITFFSLSSSEIRADNLEDFLVTAQAAADQVEQLLRS